MWQIRLTADLKAAAQVCQWIPSPLLGINRNWLIPISVTPFLFSSCWFVAEHDSFLANELCGQGHWGPLGKIFLSNEMKQEENPLLFLFLNALVCVLGGGRGAVDGDCVSWNSSSYHFPIQKKSRLAHRKQPRLWYHWATEQTRDLHTFSHLVVGEN